MRDSVSEAAPAQPVGAREFFVTAAAAPSRKGETSAKTARTILNQRGGL